ncbi:hypothetical protein RBE51_18430 [Pseudomonas taiwanensis]|uniref:hypothetical protein n=1 Tax=Pseudomonas taiwanensis TaxID=470150 RepID=UPI0028DD7D2F|nr:hypothetical protein [Pseudomonas taiwanensis]MDT8924774.1 hypothetical protein [Pseudomonas taiwanensis]
MNFDLTNTHPKPQVQALADNLSLALGQHNLPLLQEISHEIQLELQQLAADNDISGLAWLAQHTERAYTYYLLDVEANREIGLWLLPRLSVEHADAVTITDHHLATKFAEKACSGGQIHNAHFFLANFYRQGRPHCSHGLLREENLLDLFRLLEEPQQKSLILEMVGSMASDHAAGRASPAPWVDLLVEVEKEHSDWGMPTWEGASLAALLKENGLNQWFDANIREILRSPAPGDLDHFIKLDALGARLKGVEPKELFLQSLLGYSSTDSAALQNDCRLMIQAIMVYDFNKRDDYSYTTCTHNKSCLSHMKAQAASHIWKTATDQQKETLIEILNQDFEDLETTRVVKKHFDIDLYRHLAVGGVDALEDDLGL